MSTKVPVYKLLQYRSVLERMEAFNEPVLACNFVIEKYWTTRARVTDHGKPEYSPGFRAIAVFGYTGFLTSDYVTLTEEQYKVYRIVSGAAQ